MDETPEDLAALLKARPTRLLVSRVCQTCAHAWTAPSPTGNCPKCHSPDVQNVDRRINALQTL